jgi:riboflavin synthase
MFTGIVEQLGRVSRVESTSTGEVSDVRLTIDADVSLDGAVIGESIAVDGACLTVVAYEGRRFNVEATPETLRRTTLGALRVGSAVHLERALSAGARLGGHFVQGHVDAVGALVARRIEGESVVTTFTAPPDVLRYVVPKGSVAVDGVSLTVVDVLADGFTVALIPHTLDVTLLGKKPLGAPVNLEADILAKYVARAAVYAGTPESVVSGASGALEPVR